MTKSKKLPQAIATVAATVSVIAAVATPTQTTIVYSLLSGFFAWLTSYLIRRKGGDELPQPDITEVNERIFKVQSQLNTFMGKELAGNAEAVELCDTIHATLGELRVLLNNPAEIQAINWLLMEAALKKLEEDLAQVRKHTGK